MLPKPEQISKKKSLSAKGPFLRQGPRIPYWRDHLNRFGVFTLDMGRNTAEIDYELANI